MSFKRPVDWKKYQSNPATQTQNRYLNHLIEPGIQGFSRLFVLSFENDAHRRSYKRYFLIKDYSVMIDRKTFFNQLKNDLITYEYVQKIEIGKGDDYTTVVY